MAGLVMRGVEPQRLLIVLDRFVVLSGLRETIGEVKASVDGLWRHMDDPDKLLGGLWVTPQVIEANP